MPSKSREGNTKNHTIGALSRFLVLISTVNTKANEATDEVDYAGSIKNYSHFSRYVMSRLDLSLFSLLTMFLPNATHMSCVTIPWFELHFHQDVNSTVVRQYHRFEVFSKRTALVEHHVSQ